MKRRIIFVEDDLLLGGLISKALEENGFEINFLNTLNGLRETISCFHPHILILDIEVGGRNCIDELPVIRLNCPEIPIIIASSHVDGEEIVRSYNSGANKYIKKPYDIQELLFEINQLLPDKQPITDKKKIAFGNFYLNIRTQELFHHNQLIKKLSPKEFQVLKILLKKKGEIVERSELLQSVWGNDIYPESLTNIIMSLRKYISVDTEISIQTNKGLGYMLYQ